MKKSDSFWFSPDMGYYKDDGKNFIFSDGRVIDRTPMIRSMPITRKEYIMRIVDEPIE